MRLSSKRRLFWPAGTLLVFGLMLLCCGLARDVRADEWNDTFSLPREFVVKQNMTARKGPGNSFEPMGVVPQGTSVWVTHITNGWHCFKLIDGRSAYIFRRYLQAVGKKSGAEASAKKQSAEKRKTAKPSKTRQPKKIASEKAARQKQTAARNDSAGDFDEPIVEEASGIKTKKAADRKDANKRRAHQDPPETPLLAEIPQGPEDEPSAPENAEQPPAASIAALKPKTRPVRSSSFGNDGCESYKRLSFAKSAETALKGKLPSGKAICYRFLGIEGSTVSLQLEPAKGAAVFDVYTPASGHVAKGQKAFHWRCASTGDKIIVVRASKAASFVLKVKKQP